VGTHVGTPVVQEMTPGWHGSRWQAAPGVQSPQEPALHTLNTPHSVPFGAGLPVSTQVGAPAEQSMAP
jgi:hypothetical protein